MNNPQNRQTTSARAIDLFQPNPNILYSLDAAVHLTGVSRRSILTYCRLGLVQPVFQPPYGIMAFTEETIHVVQRIEHMQAVDGVSLAWIKTMFALLDEVQRLRAEVRFFRDH
jgi:DNA-binding transcriptional MerR regulator